MNQESDKECICKGNWRAIVKESQHQIGKMFRGYDGKEYRFFGIVHGDDDYYYGMYGKEGGLRLLSCVGDLKNHGFEEVNENRNSR